MSREIPILFNTDMVQAILEGRKTVTRRICKDGNDYTIPDMSFFDADKRTYAIHNYVDKEHIEELSLMERTCPICPGDILYVRETWCRGGLDYHEEQYYYKADNNELTCCWSPSIHMPKAAARIWLKVTDARVEQLQDMTLNDFLSEGISIRPEAFNDPKNARGQAKEIFMQVWNSTIKKADLPLYGWDANPYVWVIEFERCEKPERSN